MPTPSPFWENKKINIIMDDDGTFPASLTAYDGSTNTGNAILIVCNSENDSNLDINPNKEIYKLNDDNVYGIKVTTEGVKSTRLYERSQDIVEFIKTAVADARKAGKKILDIEGLGYDSGSYIESFAIGEVTEQLHFKSNTADSNIHEFTATPPKTTLTLSTTNLWDIEQLFGIAIQAPGPVSITKDDKFKLVYT